MTTVTEMLGGGQVLLGLNYDVQVLFEERLSDEQRLLIAILRLVEDESAIVEVRKGRGRTPYDMGPFLRAFVLQVLYRIPTVRDLIKRLESDANSRMICGLMAVPSEASFSRRFAIFSETHIAERIHASLAKAHLKDEIVLHISRDSMAIHAREKPWNRKRDIALTLQPKRRRGRPRKGETHPEKKIRRLAKQISQKPGKSLSELDKGCAWGCKRNSQGNVSYWKGYKLHLDTTESGIPVTAVVTAANVHDSQVAIPMEKLTERRVTHLYSVMDAAYDAAEIRSYIAAKGRVPLIDTNRRRDGSAKTFDPAEKERFKVRSSAERANSTLRDWLIGPGLYVRGIGKVSFKLILATVVLAAIKILQHLIEPRLKVA